MKYAWHKKERGQRSSALVRVLSLSGEVVESKSDSESDCETRRKKMIV